MKRNLTIVLIISMFLIFNFSASAQEEESRDILEVSFKGGFAIPDGGIKDWNDGLNASSGWDIGLDIGYFLNENVVFGFNFTYQKLDVDFAPAAGTSHQLYNPNLYLKYIKISESNWEPYVFGKIGIENPKFTSESANQIQNRYRALSYDPAFAYGFGAGLYYWRSDYSGLFIEGSFHGALTSSITATYRDNDYAFNSNLRTFNINAGVRFLFSSGE